MASRSTLTAETRSSGLYLPALDLYLDPQRRSDTRIFGSREPLSILRTRRPNHAPDTTALEWSDAVEVTIVRAFGGRTARRRVAPAGHVLGASQLVVDTRDGRLVYTGGM